MTTTMRKLKSSDEEYESPYFEEFNADGDSYSLAWRYLGVFIDEDYARKVLWAAYYDPNYSGYQIGEYSYYDWENSKWDNSTCVDGGRCALMDCHNTTSSTWELVGVYKDSLEFDNDTFFEQLFKHQGICLWGGDNSDYQFMQEMRENDMANYGSCYYIESGIYIGAKPVENGDLSLAVYSDTYCQTELSSYSVGDYVSSSSGSSWSSALETWNGLMDAYKTCQPCRAYSKYYNIEDDWHRRFRRLVEYEDGQGDEEANGFNCYDDAGYRNCNQCYKFETHTDMEEASIDDLELATKQGGIVPIDVDDVSYGGNYTYYEVEEVSYSMSDSSSSSAEVSYSVAAAAGFAGMVVGGLLAKYRCKRRRIVTADGDTPLDQPVLA